MNVQMKTTASVIAIVILLLTLIQRDSTLLTIINLESLIFTLLLVAIMDILIKSPHKINRYWWKLLSHMNVAGNVV